jgi:flagellin
MTNASALTALQSLNATNRTLETTQTRISTGMRVSEASDNAAYWSIATTMRSDAKALSTVQDALGLGASKVDTAYTGITRSIEVANELKVKLVASVGATAADKAKIQTEIKALQGQLRSYADASTFSGTNFLVVTSDKDATGAPAGPRSAVQPDTQIVSAFNRAANGSVSISTITIKVDSIKLFEDGTFGNLKNSGIVDRPTAHYSTTAAQNAYTARYNAEKAAGAADLDAHDDAVVDAAAADPTAVQVVFSAYSMDVTHVNASDGMLRSMVARMDAVIVEMTTAATKLGAAKSSIALQKTFTTSLMDSIERGVGQLVDADMNKESTRLQALQVQQQLGIQALSIANGNSQSILSLFR